MGVFVIMVMNIYVIVTMLVMAMSKTMVMGVNIILRSRAARIRCMTCIAKNLIVVGACVESSLAQYNLRRLRT